MFEEVLPTIRKHGAYASEETLLKVVEDPNSFLELLKTLMGEQEKNKALQNELLLTQPKAEYFDKLVESNLLMNFRTSAKEIGVKQNTFITVLISKGYLFRKGTGTLYPYQKYVDCGLFQVKEFYRNKHAGTQTLLTPKGRDFFLKLFSELSEDETDDEPRIMFTSFDF
ncbi:MAG: phage antirepressor KilAC domain-containing protein [Eubacteriales bacterium]